MKILYFTDVHLKEKNPISRADNYLESMMEKLFEIGEMTVKLKPDLVICGGDLFDSAHQSIFLQNKAIECIDNFVNRCLPVQVVLGNHEWRGRWEDWVEKSAFKVLQAMNKVHLYERKFERKLMGFKIVSIHDQFVEKPVLWPHHLWKDYDGTADIFLVSDYHPHQGAKIVKTKKGPVLFVAPGAISRGSRSEEDMKREPMVAFITLKGKIIQDVDVKFFTLKCAKPPEEVFRQDLEIEALMRAIRDERKEAIEEAVTNLKELKDKIKIHDPSDLIMVVGKRIKADRKVMERCLTRLESLP
jgi:DNA repair exonuclease SbcCD nuclease subunit